MMVRRSLSAVSGKDFLQGVDRLIAES